MAQPPNEPNRRTCYAFLFDGPAHISIHLFCFVRASPVGTPLLPRTLRASPPARASRRYRAERDKGPGALYIMLSAHPPLALRRAADPQSRRTDHSTLCNPPLLFPPSRRPCPALALNPGRRPRTTTRHRPAPGVLTPVFHFCYTLLFVTRSLIVVTRTKSFNRALPGTPHPQRDGRHKGTRHHDRVVGDSAGSININQHRHRCRPQGSASGPRSPLLALVGVLGGVLPGLGSLW